MKNKKVFNMILVIALAISLIFAVPAAVFANDFEISNSYEFKPLTEVEIDALWEQAWIEAEAAVTPEQIAEIEKMMAETEAFYANLTRESLWEEFISEHPEIFELSPSEIQEIRQEIDELYEFIVSNMTARGAAPFITGGSIVDIYTRHFSTRDGLADVTRNAIRAQGFIAQRQANSTYPNNRWRNDAFRHYYWNVLSVNATTVGITQNGRVNSTRIYTTNRELATNILNRRTDLYVNNPTTNQIATAVNLRNDIINANQTAFRSFFYTDTPLGREDAMDLWNNEMGRQDGVAHPVVGAHLRFTNRWNANTIVRSNDINNMTRARVDQIRNNNWHRPVR